MFFLVQPEACCTVSETAGIFSARVLDPKRSPLIPAADSASDSFFEKPPSDQLLQDAVAVLSGSEMERPLNQGKHARKILLR